MRVHIYISCKPHGLHFHPQNCLENTLLACKQDALRPTINTGQAFTCINDDELRDAMKNLLTSIAAATGPLNADKDTFGAGHQAGGLTIGRGYFSNF